jgi:hypothetical protein
VGVHLDGKGPGGRGVHANFLLTVEKRVRVQMQVSAWVALPGTTIACSELLRIDTEPITVEASRAVRLGWSWRPWVRVVLDEIGAQVMVVLARQMRRIGRAPTRAPPLSHFVQAGSRTGVG